MSASSRIFAGAITIAIALCAVAPRATGQAIPVQAFQPSPHPLDYFAVSGSETIGHLGWSAGLFLNYARDPLVVRQVGGGVVQKAVSDQLTADLMGALGLFDWLEVGLVLPVHLWVDGAGVPPGGPPPAAGVGDLKLTTRFRVLDHEGEGFGLAIEAPLEFPTGRAAGDYLGNPTVTFSPLVVGELRWPWFRAALDLGVRLRGAARVHDLEVTHELTWALGLGVQPGTEWVELIGELGGTASLADPTADNARRMEALLGARAFPMEGLTVSAGVGFGILHGFGTPAWRVFAGVGYRAAPDPDKDGDGILNEADACEEEPEDADGFQDADGCPDPDNDQDGIGDLGDACPLDKEDLDGFQDTDGCPDPDNDGDGVLDEADGCPLVAEDADGFQDADGCPDPDNDFDLVLDVEDRCPNDEEDVDGFEDVDGCPDLDNDQDGIEDDDDECPDEPENVNGCKDEDGCPEAGRVCVTAKKIVALEPIYFVFGKAKIRKDSHPVLEEMARVIKDHPELGRVRVEGHTDDVGSAKRNLRLSKARAKAIHEFLLKQKVRRGRVAWAGFGESRPLVPNDSEENRAKNRRVEFVVLGGDR